MADPSKAAGGYQILSVITQDSSSSDYDYPIDPAAERSVLSSSKGKKQLQNPANAPAFEMTEARKVTPSGQDLIENARTLEVANSCLQESFSSSDCESSDSEGRTIVRQVPRPNLRAMNGSTRDEDKSDEKLYITGNLVGTCPSVFWKTGTVPVSNEDFAEEGIYQGLIMTDKQKKNFGILPESIYMTTNLMENSALIESLSLSDSVLVVAKEEPQPRTDVVVLHPASPDMVLHPASSRIFGKDTAVVSNSTIPTASPPKPPRRGKAPEPDYVPIRSIAPRYRWDLILRPPPLPPLSSGATRAERKAFAVVENMLKSEAAYLTSLNIAIKVYMEPLKEMAEGPAPILTAEEIDTIFGPVYSIIEFQEIFYSAVTSRTLDWTPLQKIGDVLSSLSTKDVVQNYSGYVNNFTNAMAMLEKAINKKQKFVQFLKEKYANSRTSLSLQGLLLKPIQRFPQYIMFLQDLIKYTCSGHPDRVTLQMALARYEGIANFLNESKRQQEQKAVVMNLANKISHLPFKLTDGKRRLYRQDIVSRLLLSNGKVVGKDRCLLLFNNMVLCAAMKRRKKKGFTSRSKTEELESSTGSRNFQSIQKYFYSCKWYTPLDELEICTPDYLDDIWDEAAPAPLDSNYIALKAKYKELESDLLKMGSIAKIAATLHEEYKGLTCEELAKHVRIILRKIAELKEEIQSQQQGRLDLILPSRENDRKVQHTYAFQSEKCKLDWLNNLRYAKLKLNSPVATSWVIAEDVSQGDVFEVSYKLPLLVDKYTLNMINNELLSVHCAAKVGQTYVWLASGDSRTAQVSIVECVTPSPLILECFKVDSKRIIDIMYVPPSTFFLPGPAAADAFFATPTTRRNSRSSSSVKGGMTMDLPTQIPGYMATVWMGSQCGRLVLYNADSAGDEGPNKQCLATIKLKDAVTSIQYYKDHVFVSTAEGSIVIFKRNASGFRLSVHKTVQVSCDTAIRCTCQVGNKLWVGVAGSCYFFNMQTHKVEGDSVKLISKEGAHVSKMVNQGEGVWVSYKGSSSLELFHTISKSSLQNIDIYSTLNAIVRRHQLEKRLPMLPTHIHVTSIMVSNGYLWIGTSMGVVMVYHIPHLESVPIVSGKPYLAMDAHVGAVRVLLAMETVATYESSRLGKFLADENFRTLEEEGKAEEGTLSRDVSHDQWGVALDEDRDVTLTRKRSASDPNIHLSGKGVEPGDVRHHDNSSRDSIIEERYEMAPPPPFERSVTPLLLDPSTVILEESTKVEGAGTLKILRDSAEVTPEPPESEGGANCEVKGQVEDIDYDYTPDELAAKKKFREGVRGIGGTDGGGDNDTLDKLDLASASIDASMKDSGDYTIPYMDLKYGMGVVGVENPYCNPRELDGVPRDLENPYSNPQELDSAPRDLENPYSNPRELENAPRSRDLELTLETPYNTPLELGLGGWGKEGVYSVPHELDITSAAAEKKEGDYDFPVELVQSPSESSANPYEDPATLAKDPSPLSQFFSKGMKDSMYVPGRPQVPKEGAIFVLTAGRGLKNLRPGKKAVAFNQANKDTEGCMIAYEIEM